MKNNKEKDPVSDLIEILREGNIQVSFDMFRDVSKGCGEHCRAWVGNENKPDIPYCSNHQAAIDRGEYKPRN